MEQKRSAVALPVAVAALVLCAAVLMACAPAAAEEPRAVASPEATTTVAAAADARSPGENVPAEVREPEGTPAEAAGQFASALVAGDLVAATRSFAPSGLAAARALVNQRQTTNLSHFYSVTLQSMDAAEDRTRWEIVFAISSSRGESRLWTRWEWFEAAGWRIAALRPIA